MASNNYIYKMSNAGGMSTITRYTDMLAGNTAFVPWSPAGAYESIATVTLSSAASITFTSIPSTYTHLQIRGLSNVSSWIQLQLNGTTGNNYTYHELRGNGSSASASGGGTGDALIALGAGSTHPTAFVTDILDYANTNKLKTVRTLYGSDQNGSGNVGLTSNLYLTNTNAITSITFYSYALSNLPIGTTISLYGIRGN